MKVFKQVLSILLVIVAISQLEVAFKSEESIVLGLGFSLFQFAIAYLIWPKKHNSLIQFGYSYELVQDLAELDFLKSKIAESPEFKIWVGDYIVIAYNEDLTDEKFAVAQLKQFTKEQLRMLSPQSILKYHSFDKRGIWFKVVTDEKLKRLKTKPYPFK